MFGIGRHVVEQLLFAAAALGADEVVCALFGLEFTDYSLFV